MGTPREVGILSADAIVVLGCAVREDGTPSGALERRVRGGVELFSQGRAPILLMSGGAVANSHVEAEVMAGLALDLGVPESALVLERDSRSTFENAALSRPLVVGSRVVIVSDGWHLRRARRHFLAHFEVVEVHPVHGSPWSRVRGGVREGIVYVSGTILRRNRL